ncbi:DUF1120 domain-containing protein [Xylophilus rhododendri]|uniref:DUF1120 domain-containing protein n=1 Tax=Xylophilus rhododendri TaxID=2697032 RepID=A0A857J7F6_9BURK|nr:DUF1120 domain-containing protein [Xylophilus rhododendri]QHI98725.1 DUF1120 domain-containing protein [Xylophilus rhododendri]
MWPRKNVVVAAGLLLATCLLAQAQVRSSTGWSVAGTITPSPCVLTLTGGGVADFGPLSTATVKAWPVKSDPARYSGIDANVSRSMNLSVSCTSSTRFALSFVDNRAGTMSGPAGQGYSYGLGGYAPPGEPVVNIGRYVVNFSNLYVGRSPGDSLSKFKAAFLADGAATPSSTWTQATGLDAVYLPAGKSLGFTADAFDTAPGALARVLGGLVFMFEPLKAVVDGATSDMSLDGSATITLIGL